VVSSQLQAPPALTQKKEPLVPLEQEAGWAPLSVWTSGEEKNSQLLPGIEPPVTKITAYIQCYYMILRYAGEEGIVLPVKMNLLMQAVKVYGLKST